MLNNQKAEIAQTGIVCPQFEVTLPQDNENNKALVLGTIAMLPWSSNNLIKAILFLLKTINKSNNCKELKSISLIFKTQF